MGMSSVPFVDSLSFIALFFCSAAVALTAASEYICFSAIDLSLNLLSMRFFTRQSSFLQGRPTAFPQVCTPPPGSVSLLCLVLQNTYCASLRRDEAGVVVTDRFAILTFSELTVASLNIAKEPLSLKRKVIP